MQKQLTLHFSKLLMLAALLFGMNAIGQIVNITPTRSAVSGFSTWTDVTVEGSAYLQLVKANSSTTTPSMNFDQYTNETLNFTARTYGGSTAAEIVLTVSVSVDGGAFTAIGTRTPASNNLLAQAAFDLSNYNGANIRIKFSVAGTSDAIGVGISAITITGTAAAAPTPSLAVTGTTAFGSTCLNTAVVQQYTITNNGTAATNVTAVSGNPQFAVSALSATSIAAGGNATYSVTFTPESAGAKTADITVTSTTSGSNTVTSSLTGTGIATTAQAVTTATATAIASTTAVLNGNLTTVGVCPATIEKGFVYSATATNANPLVSGTGVTKAVVNGTASGSYTLSPVILGETSYSYKAYAYDGTTYTYGAVQTFTTLPAITVATNATVDAPFAITFTDNAAWRNGISSIKINNNTLGAAAYNKTVAGEISFTPSASTLLQSAGSKSVEIISSGYGAVTLTQVIGAGAATKLTLATQPTAPATNGTALATQPIVNVKDQYNNTVTTSTAPVAASANTTTTPWTLGGATALNSVNGIATFTNLTATSAELVSGATITFTSGSLTPVISSAFVVPAPPAPAPVNDLCANATTVTVNAAETGGTLNGATNTSYSNSGTAIDVWYTFTASCTGNHTVTVTGFTGDVDIILFNNTCPTNNNTNLGTSRLTSTTETITASLTSGSIYSVRVYSAGTSAQTSPFTIRVNSISQPPVVASGAVSALAYNTATVSATTSVGGCSSALISYGIEYSTTAGFANGTGTQVTGTNLNGVNYSVILSNLSSGTAYYFKSYAQNATGITYSAQATFTTPVYTIPAPVATEGTNITTSGFTANWLAQDNAVSYRLDVATSPDFLNTLLSEDFSGFTDTRATGSAIIPANLDSFFHTTGWTGSQVFDNIGTPGMARLGTGGNAGSLTTPAINLSGNGGNATFTVDLSKYSNDAVKVRISYAANGTTFVQLGSDLNPIPSSPTTYSYELTGGTANSKIKIESLGGDQRYFIDNIKVSYNTTLPAYNNITVNGTSKEVTGLLSNTFYYYRVRAIEATGTPTNSNTITVKTGTVKTWTANGWSPAGAPTTADPVIVAAHYDAAVNGSFSAYDLTVAVTGSLDITAGKTVTVVNAVTNNATAAAVVVHNNGALLQTAATATNVNPITVIKNSNPLFRLDYTLWASPVAGQTFTGFSSETTAGRYYEYQYTPADNAEHYVVVDGTASFAAGKGYLVRMPNTNAAAGYSNGTTPVTFEGTFVGEPHNGAVSIPASLNGNRYNGVGNPYPSPISVTEFFNQNSGVMDGASGIYFWRKRNNAAASSYSTLTLAGYTANAGYNGNNGVTPDMAGYFDGPQSTWLISQGQGFLVRTQSTPSTTAISFTNSMRRAAPTTGNQAFFRTAQSTTSRLWLNLTNGQDGFSQSAIAYIDGATTGLDYGYDGRQFTDNNAISLYSIAADTKLAIQARPAFTTTDVVAMGFNAATAGQYTISLDHTDGIFNNGQVIYLKDNVMGVTRNITDNSYSFTTEAGTFNNRFEVVYATSVLDTPAHEITANSVMVYKQNNTISINAGTTEINDVTVYDIRGRKLLSQNGINATQVNVTGLQVANEVLIVEINTVKGKISKKIVF